MITLQDVQDAHRRIKPYVRRTPLGRSHTLSQMLGTNINLKYEVFQKTGSFKPRGAFNQILQLNLEDREHGVVAVSGGNFAQGVAYAGQVLDIQALICMPAYTPENYIDATQSYGAEVELAPTIDQAFELARSYQRQGRSFLHPSLYALSLQFLASYPQNIFS